MTAAWRFDTESDFETHCGLIEGALPLINRGAFGQALGMLDAALELGESPHARWNRAQVLLALGRYAEGWEDYRARWHLFGNSLTEERSARLRTVLPLWQGEDLAGKRLVVIHEAGFGDTIMLLRYVNVLRRRSIETTLVMPPELERLASQIAPLFDVEGERDVYCTTFDLPRILGMPARPPYLRADIDLVHQWQDKLDGSPKIGIAWSTVHPAPWRCIDLGILARFLKQHAPDHGLVALQTNDIEAARAHGVATFEVRDFADLAALISCVSRVVSIDTAAVHVAGAIGHADVTALLPHVPCWRWLNGNPWYPQIRIRRQAVAGDWSSALSE